MLTKLLAGSKKLARWAACGALVAASLLVPMAPSSADEPIRGCLDGSVVTRSQTSIAFTPSGDLLIANPRAVLKVLRPSRAVVSQIHFGSTGLAELDSDLVRTETYGMTTDAAGNIYLAFVAINQIFKVDTSGHAAIYAGTGVGGYSGDGGLATDANLDLSGRSDTVNMTVDSLGNLFVSDYNHDVVRKIDGVGIITTVIGAGSTFPSLDQPTDLSSDGNGNVYIVNRGEHSVLKRDSNGQVTTVFQDQENDVFDMVSDSQGNIFFLNGSDGWGAPMTGSLNKFVQATGTVTRSLKDATVPMGYLAVNAAGNIFISNRTTFVISQFNPVTGEVTRYAGEARDLGQGILVPWPVNGSKATRASISYPTGMSTDSAGNVYFSGYSSNDGGRVIKIDASTNKVTNLVGSSAEGFAGDGGLASAATINWPVSPAVDGADNVYFIDNHNNRIRKITKSTGLITTVAGNGDSTWYSSEVPGRDLAISQQQEGGLATEAELFIRWDDSHNLALDDAGNIYVVNASGAWGRPSFGLIRKITPNGRIYTIAGNGSDTFTSAMNGHAATEASLSAYIEGMAVDPVTGDIYLSDQSKIFKISGGIITTVIDSQTVKPGALALDRNTQTLYFFDTQSHLVRRVDLSTSPATISTDVVAGGGSTQLAEQGSSSTSVDLSAVNQMFFVAATNTLYVNGMFWNTPNGDGTYNRNERGMAAVQAIDLSHQTISRVLGYVASLSPSTGLGCAVHGVLPTITQGPGGSQQAAIPPGAENVAFDTPTLGNPVLNFTAGNSQLSVSVAPATNPESARDTPFSVTNSTKIVDIQVTGFSGSITVCLDGAPTDHLYHYTGGAWVDLPGRSYVNGQVCGVTSSFSPFAAAAPAPFKPRLKISPKISGKAQQNTYVTATTGTWSADPVASHSYQWYRCEKSVTAGRTSFTPAMKCTKLTGATKARYKLSLADQGKYLTALVKASNSIGFTLASTKSILVPMATQPVAKSLPRISGSAVKGNLVTVNSGVWSANPAATTTQQWYRCDNSVRANLADFTKSMKCKKIPGATRTQYTIARADQDLYLTAMVTAKNSQGVVVASAKSVHVPGTKPTAKGLAKLSGSTLEGGVLRATDGTWSAIPEAKTSLQWYRCDAFVPAGRAAIAKSAHCTKIGGATNSRYTLRPADVGRHLTVVVKAKNSYGSNTSHAKSTAQIRPKAKATKSP